MTLRVHFTADDLVRTTVAAGPDIFWELVLSLHQLQSRRHAHRFEPWLRHVRTRLSTQDLRGVLQLLTTLVPRQGSFPDFLTPQGCADFGTSLDLVRAAPPHRLREDLGRVFRARTAPPFVRLLAAGDRAALRELLDALAVYHRELLRPWMPELAETVLQERARCGRDVVDGGVEQLLGTLSPTIRWEAPVLSTDYPIERELHLGGRGITLVPSFFCRHLPVTLIDPELPPVLVYPISTRARPATSPDGLAALLGCTRASALGALGDACSTSELALRIDVSAGTASRHAAALRDAGLVTSARYGSVMLHTATRLGRELASRPA